MNLITKKRIFMLSFIILVSAIMIYFLIKINPNYQGQYYNHQKLDEKLIEITKQEQNATLEQHSMIENKFVQAIFKRENGTYQSFFIDVKNGELLGIEDMIKPDRQESFKNKMKELINLKYPKFIADVLNYGNGKITYILQETELLIYFYEFEITPKPTNELTLQIDYNEIKDDVDFSVNLKEEYESENGFLYDKAKKTVALTFDDGPNREKTLRLAELLRDNKMHATFFMVGNRMGSAPDVINELLKDGNEIGSHSYNHKNLTRLTSEELIQEEDKTNQIYKSITGKDLKLLRAPYGSVNDKMKENLNYIFINWNLDTEDWRYRNKDHIYNSVIENIKDGDIILMHDLYDTTIEAVEKLLPELYVQGYQVVTVSELANLKGSNLEPHKVYRFFK